MNDYQDTINTYNRLGKQYIENIAPYVASALKNFVNDLPRNSRVLDLGCAGGRDTKFIADKEMDVVGIDLAIKLLQEARKYAPNAKFYQMDMLDLKFPDESFDAVIASAVLIHLHKKDLDGALKEIHRVLKPTGKLYTTVKYGVGEGLVTDSHALNEGRFFVYYTQKEIVRQLEKTGFLVYYSEKCPDDAGRKDIYWIRLFANRIGI